MVEDLLRPQLVQCRNRAAILVPGNGLVAHVDAFVPSQLLQMLTRELIETDIGAIGLVFVAGQNPTTTIVATDNLRLHDFLEHGKVAMMILQLRQERRTVKVIGRWVKGVLVVAQHVYNDD